MASAWEVLRPCAFSVSFGRRCSRQVATQSLSIRQHDVPVVTQLPPRVKRDPDSLLLDRFGRRHHYLRLSLTDKCNQRCKYCVDPDEKSASTLPASSSRKELSERLTADEIERLVALFMRLGTRKLRLTGGEPTTRRDFSKILDVLGGLNASVPEPLTMGITTNGVRLRKYIPQLRSVGLRNVNLSLDTLVSAKFPFLTRSPESYHTRTMEVLRSLLDQSDFFKVKVNCVVLRGVNDEEIGAFVDLSEHEQIEVRFLEFMPFDSNNWSAGRLVSQADIIKAMQRHLERRGVGPAERLAPDSIDDVANFWKVPGWQGRIGLIASMTDAFCSGCSRLRITADGQLRNCLFGEEGWSLRDQIRAGADDDALIDVIVNGLQSKHAKLGGKRDMHELQQRSKLGLPMMTLGG